MSLAWVLLGSGICESSSSVASFGVLSENGAMVGVWRSLRFGCLACECKMPKRLGGARYSESRRLWQHCFLFTKNSILPHMDILQLWRIE